MKQALLKGDEVGAGLFAAQANAKEVEYRKNVTLSSRLAAMAGAINQNNGNIEQMKALEIITPIVESQGQTMNIDEVLKNLDRFDQANNNLDVTGKMMGEVMSKQFQTTSSNDSTDKILQQLKGEIMIDNLGNIPGGPIQIEKLPDQEKQENSGATDFYAGLKKIN